MLQGNRRRRATPAPTPAVLELLTVKDQIGDFSSAGPMVSGSPARYTVVLKGGVDPTTRLAMSEAPSSAADVANFNTTIYKHRCK